MMKNMHYLRKIFIRKQLLYVLIICVSIYIFTAMHPTFLIDESFTFSLINHSYLRLITLDAMDVHPPLFYILLKFFLLITTFWTKSIFIKVFFARLFSVICFLMFYMYACNLLHIDKCSYKTFFSFLIFLMFPIVYQNIFKIRMYELSSLLLLLELYNLMKFEYGHGNKYLIYATVFAIFSSYTFYFSAISSGIYILILFIKYFYLKNYRDSFKIFLSGIVMILGYLPWIPFVMRQYFYHTKSDNGTSYYTIVNVIKNILSSFTQLGIKPYQLIISLFVFPFFVFLFFYSLKYSNRYFNHILVISIINAIVTFFISLIVCGKEFQIGVLFPIFSIYGFCMAIMIMKITILNNCHLFKLISVLFFSFFVLFSVAESCHNIIRYDVPSYSLYRRFNKWSKRSNDNIIINNDNKYPISPQLTFSEDAVYLSSINKNLVVKNYTYKQLSKGLLNNDSNFRLLRGTFTNLKVHKKVHK